MFLLHVQQSACGLGSVCFQYTERQQDVKNSVDNIILQPVEGFAPSGQRLPSLVQHYATGLRVLYQTAQTPRLAQKRGDSF